MSVTVPLSGDTIQRNFLINVAKLSSDLFILVCISWCAQLVAPRQGTVNGIGERTGNANLMTIIPTLQLKMGVQGVGESLGNLTALSRFTDEQASIRFSSVPQV